MRKSRAKHAEQGTAVSLRNIKLHFWLSICHPWCKDSPDSVGMPVQQLRIPTPQGTRAALPDEVLPRRAVPAAGLTGAGGLKWLGIFL